MAGESDYMKRVSFIGAWRTQHVSEQLLRQISNQMATKKKIATQVKITSEGLELLIFDNEGKLTRKDKIALENIVDLIDNKYFVDNKTRTACTLAIVREKQQKVYTVFVFLCKSDADAAALIQTFKTVKRQLSGEGFNTNLTPKGKNWVLQPKNEKSMNQTVKGDMRGKTIVTVPVNDVQVINTEKQNGGVMVIDTFDRHDSMSRESIKTSNSEVKEELHNLADEVRGIKKLLQGSKGRAQFEKHYGYRILQGPPQAERQIAYVERNIDTRPAETIPGNVYIKNESSVRYANGGPPVIRVGGRVSRSTKQYKTRGHFVSVKSPTRQDYRKRVYDSENPYVESGSVIRPVRIIGRPAQQQHVVVPRQRLYQPMSQSTDIVHKNIEDVYKSRSIRRMYLPPSPPQNSNTVEYVKSHMLESVPKEQQLVKQKVIINREGQLNAVHVKYDPQVRTYYEPINTEISKTESNSQASTEVNTSVNDNLEDKMKQIESSLDIEQSETRQDRNGNVVFIKTVEEDNQSNVKDIEENTMYVQNNSEVGTNLSSSGGNVYHVRAEFADEYEKNLGYDKRVTVVKSTVVNDEEDKVNKRNVAYDENVTIISLDKPYSKDVHVERNRKNEVIAEIENTESNKGEDLLPSHTTKNETVETVINVGENSEFVQEYAKEVSQNEDSINDVINERSFDKENVKMEIEGQLSERLQNEKDDGGLFGAYTKRPEEDDEPKNVISSESAYRYRDDDEEATIRVGKNENYTANRFGVFVNEEKNTESNKFSTEEIENNQTDIEKNIELIEEKHVRYNEMVEQIPFEDDEPEPEVNNVKLARDVYEAHTHENYASQDNFKSELSSVVSRIRHNYDEKMKEEEESDSGNLEEEEEKYVLDLDALKAYSTEPDIIIVDAENDKTESVGRVNDVEKTNTFVLVETNETERKDAITSVDTDKEEQTDAMVSFDTFENKKTFKNKMKDKKEIVDEELDDEVLKIEGENLEMFNRVNNEEIQLDSTQTVTSEDVHEFINTTEDKVLF